MPRVKRWFPVSHDINSDPEVWELTDLFGVGGLRMWLECLSLADKNEGEIKGNIERNCIRFGRLFGRNYRKSGEKRARNCLELMLNFGWIELKNGSIWIVNYAKYNKPREQKDSPNEDFIGAPPDLTGPDLTRKEKKKDTKSVPKEKKSAAPDGAAPAMQSRTGGEQKSQASDQARNLAAHLAAHIAANYPNSRKPTVAALTHWAVEIDRLHRLDGKDWELIEAVLTWSQTDSFWRQNIQSGQKLREKWNQLLAKYETQTGLSGRESLEDRMIREFEEKEREQHGDRTGSDDSPQTFEAEFHRVEQGTIGRGNPRELPALHQPAKASAS